MRTRSIVIVVILTLAAGAVGGYYAAGRLPLDTLLSKVPSRQTPSAQPSAPRQPPPVAVEAIEVVYRPLARRLSAVGSLVAEESVMVRPEISGRIVEIGFTEGQHVKRGQLLFRLDDEVLRAELQQAQANLALAQTKYKRAEELQRRGFLSQQARDEARNDLQVQQANVALARARLEKASILAPFDGEIGLRYVSVGDYVSSGQDLVTLQATNRLKADFRIPEVYLGQIHVGQKLEVGVDAMPGRVWTGTVTAISPLVDVAGRSLVMRAVIDNNDDLLRPGLFARVNVLLNESDALMVPETALAPRGNQQYVLRVENDRVREVAVQIGQRSHGMVEIVAGLQPGDKVITAGLQKVSDGTRVAVTLVPSS